MPENFAVLENFENGNKLAWYANIDSDAPVNSADAAYQGTSMHVIAGQYDGIKTGYGERNFAISGEGLSFWLNNNGNANANFRIRIRHDMNTYFQAVVNVDAGMKVLPVGLSVFCNSFNLL